MKFWQVDTVGSGLIIRGKEYSVRDTETYTPTCVTGGHTVVADVGFYLNGRSRADYSRRDTDMIRINLVLKVDLRALAALLTVIKFFL